MTDSYVDRIEAAIRLEVARRVRIGVEIEMTKLAYDFEQLEAERNHWRALFEGAKLSA